MAFRYSPSIVVDGLVLYLDAANPYSYVSGSTVWNDLSRSQLSGSLINGPTYNSANNGSIVFDGVNDYVDCGTNSIGSNTSNYTFSVWFKTPNNSTNALVRGNDGAGNGWSLLAGTDLGKYRVGVVTTSPSVVGSVVMSTIDAPINTWVNVTGVWVAGVSLSLFANGVLENTSSITGTNLRSSTLGWVLSRITTSLYHQSNIAISQIYNRALTPSEVLQNYNATKGRFGLT